RRGSESACAGPATGLFAGEDAPREPWGGAAVLLEDVHEVDLGGSFRGAGAVVVGELIARRNHRHAAVVRRRSRGLAVVAPARVRLTQAIDDVVLPGIVDVFQASRARLRGERRRALARELLDERADVWQRRPRGIRKQAYATTGRHWRIVDVLVARQLAQVL